MIKSCVICGNEFSPFPGTQKTCSAVCSRERRRRTCSNYYFSHKERHNNLCATNHVRRRDIINGRAREKYRADHIYRSHKNGEIEIRRRREKAAYQVLAEMLGSKDNLNQLLQERNLI